MRGGEGGSEIEKGCVLEIGRGQARDRLMVTVIYGIGRKSRGERGRDGRGKTNAGERERVCSLL